MLADVPPLELPTDHPRAAIRSSRGAMQPVSVPSELSEEIRALARRENATSYMALLAAFQVLLGRWCGQQTFAIGTPAANRTRPKTANLIGYVLWSIWLIAFAVLLLRGRPGRSGSRAAEVSATPEQARRG